MPTARDALEAALARTPDDLTLHRAYADCLIEDGDPRGEWIRLCLEKERPDLTAVEKRNLGSAIRRLRSAHIGRWNGPFSEYPVYPTFGTQDVKPEMLIRWKRGWIWHFQATPYDATVVDLVLNHPYLRLVHSLILFRSEWARNPGPPVEDFTFLRHLRIPAVKILSLCDRGFDDRALAHLLAAPFFPNVRDLSLGWTNLTDVGGGMLAGHPHTAKLKRLSLEGTGVTQSGIDELRRVGRRVTNPFPHHVPEPDYLNDGIGFGGPG